MVRKINQCQITAFKEVIKLHQLYHSKTDSILITRYSKSYSNHNVKDL